MVPLSRYYSRSWVLTRGVMVVMSRREIGRMRKKPCPLMLRSKGRKRKAGSVMCEVNLMSRWVCYGSRNCS